MKHLNCLYRIGLLFVSAASAASGESIEWSRQLGTSGTDYSYGVSADGLGNVYISGQTTGSLGGPNAGSSDAFVSMYDAAGTLLWSRQLGTSESDYSRGVSTDGLGNIYISGVTWGSLGGPNAGNSDAFVSKYDASGAFQWTRQLGTVRSEESSSVSADRLGNVYISGNTYGSLGGPNAGNSEAFVSKYDASGNLQWSRQMGSIYSDYSNGVSADCLGNVYISGQVWFQNEGSTDAFVSKYDASGNLQWSRQLEGVYSDRSNGVSADGLGNVYISGQVRGPSDSRYDAFVRKYDAAGTLQWTRQLGTYSSDYSLGVSADGLGSVYISGVTYGSLGGPRAGSQDAFVSKHDASGNFQWTYQLGTSSEDASFGVSADGLGNVYFSGNIEGSFQEPNFYVSDAFVAKIVDSVVPEPNTLLLLSFGSLTVLWRRRAFC